MRKRRGFALLLALSLAVSSNGMTVLAAPEGTDVQTEQGQESAKLTEAQKLAAQKRQEADAAKQLADEKQQAVKDAEAAAKEAQEKWTKAEADLNALKNPTGTEGTTATDEQKAVQDAGKTVGEKNTAVMEKESALKKAKDALKALTGTAEGGTSENTGDTDVSTTPNETDSEDVKAAKKAVADAQTALEQAQAELQKAKEDLETAKQAQADLEKPQQPADADAVKKAEDAVEAAKTKKDEADEALTKAQAAYDVAKKAYDDAEAAAVEAEKAAERDVSFTDDTGKKVTYDANAANEYIYEVENGVLKSVKKAVPGEGDSTVTVPVEFVGNIVLKQPEGEGSKYTSVAADVFAGNQKVTYVQLPAGVTTVAAGSFKGCTALESVSLPSTLLKIESSAFENCTAMTQISVPKTVTEIGDSAFQNDAKLHLVRIKDTDYSDLTTIGAHAFEGCTALAEFCSDTAFVLPTKLTTIGEAAFKGCKSIKKVDFTDTKLTSLGASAFENCTGIRDLSPGKTLALISDRAFSGCTSLASINFVNGVNMTIGSHAFEGCIGLKQLVLPQSVVEVRDYAFAGCTRLVRVELKCYNIIIGGTEAFPGNADGMVIVAEEGSAGYRYAKNKNLLPDKDGFYQYTVENVDGTLIADGKFPGGKIWIGTTTQDGSTKDVNVLNGKKGVKSGEKCFVYYEQTEEQKKNYTFIGDSLRCNGTPLKKESGKYVFNMPEGGAVITAEFRANTPDKIDGQNVKVEFSAGEALQNGKQDANGCLGVELKVGQTSRMFLLDGNGASIPSNKITFSSKDTKIATINSSGLITAVGTGSGEKADTTVSAEVVGGDGKKILINRTISVRTSEAQTITIKALDYDEDVKISGDKDGIQTATLSKNIVAKAESKIRLKANVYDGDESVGKKLNWTTSDGKVATVAKASTEAGQSINEVTIQKGCEGEATITVTAQNAAGSSKEKIFQKFVIRVYKEGYKLTSSTVTVNPNMKTGGSIELISAYGVGLKDATIKLYDEEKLTTTNFTAEYNAAESKENCKVFNVVPVVPTIKAGTYKARVSVNGDTNEKNFLPLTITVKRTMPNPTIKFNSERTKFNLFYKDGGRDADGNATVVTTEITKLGDVEIDRVALEGLSGKEDDQLFTKNFVIDKDRTDLSAGRVVIRRSDESLKYTSRKQAALTGNLVIYYKGFDESAAKKMKVTMPNCTTAPSLALKETRATYSTACREREEQLVVYDKKSKTKEQVVLDAAEYSVAETEGEINLLDERGVWIEDGAIAVRFAPDKGKMKLVLRNANWDTDKNGKERTVNFTFTVNVSNVKPTVKVSQVSLNMNYPEEAASFELVSSVKGTQFEDTQTFTPVYTRANQSEISRLQVTYTNGKGQVSVKDGQKVKKGTYKFECDPRSTDWPDLKKVSLTVKVVDGKPTVKFGRGSLQLNKAAVDRSKNVPLKIESIDAQDTGNAGSAGAAETAKEDAYEVAKVSFTVSGKPEGYEVAPVGSGAEKTEIRCTTKGKFGAEDHFVFDIKEGNLEEKTDGVLTVYLKDASLTSGTYTFTMTPRYIKADRILASAKDVKFNVKVYSDRDISLKVAAKGKINLVNRQGEADSKNGIIYTPTLQNLVGEITDVKIYDANSLSRESQYFNIRMIEEGKDAGKFFVTPKDEAVLENNTNYSVRIWVKVKGYPGMADTNNGVLSKVIKIKTSQVLPGVTVDKSTLDVYLFSKQYDATFVVTPKEGSAGEIEEVFFGEKDEKEKNSFELVQETQKDGSMKVIVHLKEGLEYSNGSTNTVKMYVKYKGQGDNTSETATAFTIKVRVN